MCVACYVVLVVWWVPDCARYSVGSNRRDSMVCDVSVCEMTCEKDMHKIEEMSLKELEGAIEYDLQSKLLISPPPEA